MLIDKMHKVIDGLEKDAFTAWAKSYKARVDILVHVGFTTEQAISIINGIFGAAIGGIKP